MKTIYWILIGLAAVLITVISTRLIVKKITKKDEEDIVNETVKRLNLGGASVYLPSNNPLALGDHHYCGPNSWGEYFWTKYPCGDNGEPIHPNK